MGRTCPTYRMLLESEIEGWRHFRDGLSEEDREALDRIFDSARRRASACSAMCRLNPFESVVACTLAELAAGVDKW
jgi:hypothetical protein